MKLILTILVLTFVAGQSFGADAPTSQPAEVGKPVKIVGTTVDGKAFSSDQWKGRVILVDLWATWCADCIAEMPHVRELYDQNHAKGLEVIAVSSDSKLAPVKKFLAAHPEYPWPQLFDPTVKDDGLHPIAVQFGIEGLPAMILIDKQGVCRSVTAGDDMDKLIPQLLAK